MVSTGIWEAWTKLIWFSPQKQLPFISHWPCSGAWQTTFGVCSMCVDYSWPILLYSSPISATNFTFRNFLIQNLGVNSYDLMFSFDYCNFHGIHIAQTVISGNFYLLVYSDFVHSILTDMHDLRLIHTDLKPENILLVSSEYIKIPDYKVSNQSSPSRTHLGSGILWYPSIKEIVQLK